MPCHGAEERMSGVGRSEEPIPRSFGNRQRLYSTVLNSIRTERERKALGQDIAGVVLMDIEVTRVRSSQP
eukprot:766680-Hanusia_phi.AAC.10